MIAIDVGSIDEINATIQRLIQRRNRFSTP